MPTPDMNTLVTVLSFLVSIIVQIVALAYYVGRFSGMVTNLEKDLQDHKQESTEKHIALQTKLDILEKEKQAEHSKFNERLGKHDIVMENIEKYLSEMKDSIKGIESDLKNSRRK